MFTFTYELPTLSCCECSTKYMKEYNLMKLDYAPTMTFNTSVQLGQISPTQDCPHFSHQTTLTSDQLATNLEVSSGLID